MVTWPMMMHIIPSRAWTTHMDHRRPRMPYRAFMASERMPPQERANKFISPKHEPRMPAICGETA